MVQITPPFEDLPEAAARRAAPRVEGPFEGRRGGALSVPVRIHDLSTGGCLIESHYPVKIGLRMKLEIELPPEGWISLDAETLYVREDYGFAVRFVNVPADVQHQLARVIDRLLQESPAE